MSCWSLLSLEYSLLILHYSLGSPGGSVGKEFTCNAGDLGSVSGLGRCPGGGDGNPPQYSGLENFIDRGAWQASDLFRPQELDMTEWLIPHYSLETWASPEKVAACKLSHSNRVQLVMIPWTVAHQALLSMGFSRQEYWSGFPWPSPGKNTGVGFHDLLQGTCPTQGLNLCLLHLHASTGEFFTTIAIWEAWERS